jgi:tRNA(Ile)-lysidine synthase
MVGMSWHEEKQRMRTIRRTVKAAVARMATSHALWPADATLVAAISGGADSLCLLGVLDDLRKEHHPLAPREIVVAHLDHGLRGTAGAADARFVAAMAEDLGLACVVERTDVAASARAEHRSLEDSARRARYGFLRRVAAEVRAARICTGHTRDDQAETVILHFLRGSGLDGLAGMLPLTGDIARPLLAVTRAESEAYCAARGWAPRQDATNADLRFARNRVRHQMLPLLEAFNPNLRATLTRNATLLADDAACLESLADDAWSRVARITSTDDHEIALDLPAIGACPAALRTRLYVRAALVAGIGDESYLEARHLALVEQVCLCGHTGQAQTLPGGLVVRRDGHALIFTRASQWPMALMPQSVPERILPVPGQLELPELGWRVRAWRVTDHAGLEHGAEPAPPNLPPFARAGDEAHIGHALTRAYLAPELSSEPLTVRTWRPGDRFRPLGMVQEKKLQDYFGDAKVPRALRPRLPLVFGPDHLLWIAGLRLDDRARLRPDAHGALILQLEPMAEPSE